MLRGRDRAVEGPTAGGEKLGFMLCAVGNERANDFHYASDKVRFKSAVRGALPRAHVSVQPLPRGEESSRGQGPGHPGPATQGAGPRPRPH